MTIMQVTGKPACFSFVFIQACQSAYPDIALLIFNKISNLVIADRIFILETVIINSEFITIIAIEPIAGTYPNKTATILHNTGHVNLRQSFGSTYMFKF